MANTIFEYYQQQGKPMPTWQERIPIAQQFGIQNYTGTAEQNAQLLAKLQQGGTPGTPTNPVAPQTPQFPNLTPGTPEYLATKAKIDEMLGKVKTLQEQQKSAVAYETGLGKTGGDIPTSVLSETPAQAQQSGRITNLEAGAFAQPKKTYDEIYQQAYEQSGMADVKTKIQAIDTQINTARDNLIKAESGITENPWLDENGRVGRIKTLYEMAEKQISNLVAQREQFQTSYTQGINQAETIATKTQAEMEAGRKLKADELEYLQKLKSGKVPTEPKTFGTSETGYYVWEYDDITKKFTQKQVVAPVAKTETMPTSYKEWQLAGSPGTYADWIAQQNIKAPTSAQQTVAEYTARIEQAEPTINNLESKISGMNFLKFQAELKLPSALQSSDIQQYMQASRNFINAKLRRESGAVINPTEFTEARQQYLPQAGDDEATLKLKSNNRKLVLESLKKAAGSAYSSVEELMGNEITQPDGTVWKVNPDGSYTRIK